MHDYHAVIEAVTPALRNERTKREAQHLVDFYRSGDGNVDCSWLLRSCIPAKRMPLSVHFSRALDMEMNPIGNRSLNSSLIIPT